MTLYCSIIYSTICSIYSTIKFFLLNTLESCFFKLNLLILIIILPMALLTTPASTSSESHLIKIRFSHVVAENTPKGWGAREFARRVNKALAGKVLVEVFSDGTLYNDNQAIEAVAMGNLEMAAPSSAKFKGFVPGLQLFDMPFLFDDLHSVHRTIDGDIGREIMEIFKQRRLGIKLLAFWDNAFKQFTCSVKPLHTPLDFKGLKFRIMESEILDSQITALGASGHQIPFSKVYDMLDKGIMDGQENTASNIFTQGYQRVQRYMTFSNHGYLGYLVIVNQDFWEGLPWTIQKQISAILKEVTAVVREKAVALDHNNSRLLREYAEKNGTFETLDLNKDEKQALKEAVTPVHGQFSEIIPQRWIKSIKRDQKKAKNYP